MESVIVFIRKVKVLLLVLCATGIFVSSNGFAGPEHSGNPDLVVLTGLDVLEQSHYKALAGQRVGLITNQTGINRRGASNIRLFHQAAKVNLVAIFSPEHGPSGKLDVELIESSEDAETGIEIFSLYGSTRRPTPEMLAGLDTLVFDIQDIGTRFYTYISTMGHAMQSAAENGIRFVVLDRPNPINGITVSGPVLDDGKQSFVGFHRLPVRHGMTIGELALMFKAELQLDLDLEIIPIEAWQRRRFFDDTGLQWVNPSPNMRNLNEAILYPGIGLLETTNLSVGRGTETPFEWIGAPWLDGAQLMSELEQLNLPGIRFKAVEFIPDSSKFKGESCNGIGFTITDRNTFESVRTGIEIALVLRRLYPAEWQLEPYDRLLGNQSVLEAIRPGNTYAGVESIFADELQAFVQRRSEFLIYP